MSSRNYCMVSGLIFVLIGLLHVWRYVLDLPLQVGVWYAPRSVSLIGAIIAGVLALWAFSSARGTKPHETVYN